jgi:negative regulator of flagellin synthesis FlgM
MDIKKLTGNDASSASAQARNSRINQYQEQQQSQQNSRDGSDTVTISNRSRQLSKISSILERDDAARADKVAALKEKVQSGTYRVDSSEVARSIISYVADGEVTV